ncbi:hypothetical protein GH714_022352 [Hevea brasiliensis]|uniref:Uncharacterized protein n=1 Tax=Hevea brasiliensis TaxID=3981 RepID=A0A6A6N3M0_HEVBR|nr:hypothetical protein GH714_022352 [Hevea brasiliensis]
MSSQTQSSVLSNLTIEDDNHKSIKYDVWASTPNGNNKLGAAFRDAERRSGQWNGQFVEMVGQRHSRGITRKTQKAIMFEKFHSENPLLLSLCRTLFPNNHKSVWCGPHSLVQREVYARTSSILAAIETLMT